MGKPSVVDEIAALIPPKVGSLPWHRRVNEEQAAMLAEILAGWRAGKFGTARRTAARTIAAYLNRHGIGIGDQGVDTWLAKTPAT